MPWRQKPKKDVVGCDKPRGAVSRRYQSRISEWGNPLEEMLEDRPTESIGRAGATGGTETSQYPEEKRPFP
jgi:hypothetical protein